MKNNQRFYFCYPDCFCDQHGGGIVPKKRTNSHGRWHVLAILAGILGFLGLLGELEMTVIGRLIYAFLKNIFGSLAWVIPLFCLFLAIGIEIRLRSKGRKKYSRKNDQRIKGKTQDQKTNKLTHTHDQVKTGIPLPKGKLVGLQGFEEYFASTEGPEIKTAEPAAAEDLSELGNDFSTYFQEGHKFSFKPLETKIVTLKGFNSYFDSVQTECEEELKEEHKEASHFQAKLPKKGNGSVS